MSFALYNVELAHKIMSIHPDLEGRDFNMAKFKYDLTRNGVSLTVNGCYWESSPLVSSSRYTHPDHC